MGAEPKNSIMCHECKMQLCRVDRGHESYPEGIPSWCVAGTYHDVLEKAKAEYATPSTRDIYMAAGKTTAKGYMKWPRIKEAIEFSKELRVKKVGLASCMSFIIELRQISELFVGAGFEVIGPACMLGRVDPRERGISEEFYAEWGYYLYCNPIAQAEIMNHLGTDLNFIIGLCMGHDILFTKYSKAPVSTLIVKDKVLGNNPSAALSSWFYRDPLWREYLGKGSD